MNQRAIVFGAVVLAILVAILLWRPWDEGDEPISRARAEAPAVERAAPSQPRSEPIEVAVPRAVTKKKGVSKEERTRYQRAIRRAMSERGSKASEVDGERSAPERSPEQKAAPGDGLTDRSDGSLTGLLKDFNDDVMPLADECYQQALERDPELAGGLNMQFQIIGDEEVGGLVESVDLLEDSDIQDAEMIECMRETLLSTIFPAPDGSGSTGVELSLRFAPDEPE